MSLSIIHFVSHEYCSGARLPTRPVFVSTILSRLECAFDIFKNFEAHCTSLLAIHTLWMMFGYLGTAFEFLAKYRTRNLPKRFNLGVQNNYIRV